MSVYDYVELLRRIYVNDVSSDSMSEAFIAVFPDFYESFLKFVSELFLR